MGVSAVNCNCTHETVCRHASEIRQAVSQIIEIRVGSHNPTWDKIEALVRDICQFRFSKTLQQPQTKKKTGLG